MSMLCKSPLGVEGCTVCARRTPFYAITQLSPSKQTLREGPAISNMGTKKTAVNWVGSHSIFQYSAANALQNMETGKECGA